MKLAAGIRRALAFPLLGSAITCGLFQAEALDPDKLFTQYIHDRWGAEQGFPGGHVYAMAETDDGYLWIGAEKGLVRFDGSNFQLFNHDNSPELPASPVLGLTTDGQDGLWVRLRSPGLLRCRNEKFSAPLPQVGSPETGVTALLRGKDGDVFLARSNEILRYKQGKFTTVVSNAEGHNLLVVSMAETDDGKVWLGTRDAGLFSLENGHVANFTEGLKDRKVNALLASGGRELWIGTDSGVVRWTGAELTRAKVPAMVQHFQTLALIRDRDSNIWAAGPDGLIRITPDGSASWDRRITLANDGVSAPFEDRDGNLWVGRAEGIERFRETVFTAFPRTEEPHAENEGPLYVDAESRTWFAPSDGGLYWFKGSHVESVTQDGLASDVVYAISGGDGELWVGRQRGGLTRLRFLGRALAVKTYTPAEGLAATSIAAVHRNRDGTVWAGSLDGGVSRFAHGVLTTYSTASGLASNDVNAIAEGPGQSMWFGGPNGLTRLVNDHFRTFTSADGLPPGNINCLFEDSTGVLWIGTNRGLAYYSADRITALDQVPESLRAKISGIAEDKVGRFWITTANQVLRVDRDALRRGTLTEGSVREYGMADGLSVAGGVRSIISDARGRVWFSLHGSISVVDPMRLLRTSTPAAARVLSISADGQPFSLGVPIRVPADPQRITLGFTGVSLSAPERIRFRYRLDGYDRDWSNPVASREAAYTNLSPGPYRFRLTARNPDGIWNKTETSFPFEIEPAVWQTWWFRIFSVLLFALAIAAVYRYRLNQLTSQLNLRFEERLAERTRIAQELHDTLLQGCLSASMLLHLTTDGLPPESPLKPRLNRVLNLMGQVTEEGRNAIRGLRSQTYDSGLDQAFSRIPEELGIDDHADFRVIVEGQRRPLHPILRDEVYRIGREALVNAFRHSKAKKIEAELEYGTKFFRVLVRDDGLGIGPEAFQAGPAERWGLIGMRERAERIGARLNVWTRESGGTEIQLFVPNHIAFETSPPQHRWKWLTRLYSPEPKR